MEKKSSLASLRSTHHEPVFHSMTVIETVNHLSTDLELGLTSDQAEERLIEYGHNELQGGDSISPWRILFRQVANMLTVILFIAMSIAFISGDYAEGAVILFVIVTNAAIGFAQEFKAEKTMESLRRLASPTSSVIRDGQIQKISTELVVPGDVLLLETGDVVGADLRIVEQFNLSIDEALLTGESVPTDKDVAAIPERDVPVGDRVNLAFSSTTVTKGRGKTVVIGTGMKTEIGNIALTLNNADSNQKTSLQKTMDKMAIVVFGMAILLCIVVFSVNEWKIEKNIAIYAVAVSIAIIPEGLIAVVTLTMAAGVRSMAKNRAIVRRTNALEILGSVTNICSDKTGTLTQAKMVLTRLWLPSSGYYSVTGVGYAPEGIVLQEGFEAKDLLSRQYNESSEEDKTTNDKFVTISPDNLDDNMIRVTQIASLCNSALIKQDPESGTWIGLGDPTENALQTFAHKLNLGQSTLSDPEGDFRYELLAEFPFDSTLKLMTAVYYHQPTGRCIVYTKGAMERVLAKCISYVGDQVYDSTPQELIDIATPHMEHLAGQGLRTLCLAIRELPLDLKKEEVVNWTRDQAESHLTMLGLVGIYDPPRPESRSSVLECHRAGISVHMLTGDHPATAAAIARDVGIIPINTPSPGHGDIDLTIGSVVMTATQFDKLTDEQLDSLPELPLVIARCSPDTKVKMIQALHRRGRIVAMTGDGVNDSPSLKISNVGIGMGLSGSDVAKQASDIVLTDDNFATIVRAVAEGRRIFENIIKFVLHLMAGNTSEIVALVVGLCFRDVDGNVVFPMSPIQILFLNMITSSPPAMGLGLEKAHPKSMIRPPRPVTGGLFTWEVISDIVYYGLIMGGLAFSNFCIVIFGFGDGILASECNSAYRPECDTIFKARATSYATLTLLILLHAFNCRSLRQPAWSFKGLRNLYSNRFLANSIILGIVLLFPAIYIPGVNHTIFHHTNITYEWGLVFAACAIFIVFSELFKAFKRAALSSDKIVVVEMSSVSTS